MKKKSISGFGLGLRAKFAEELFASEQTPDLDWLEIRPESYVGRGGKSALYLKEFSERYPLLAHSVSLSPGFDGDPDAELLKSFKKLFRDFQIPFVSDHACSVRYKDGSYAHLFLPLRRTFENAKLIAKNVKRLSEALEIPVGLEHVPDYGGSGLHDLSPVDFLLAIDQEAHCPWVLDVNNLVVDLLNHGDDPSEFLEKFPWQRVVYTHIAGFLNTKKGAVVDTHSEPPSDWALSLLQKVRQRVPDMPILFEWDGEIPALGQVLSELKRIRSVAESVETIAVRDVPKPRHPEDPNIYEDLIRLNVIDVLENAFPQTWILHQEEILQFLPDFLQAHLLKNPLYHEIPRIFSDWILTTEISPAAKFDFVKDRARYETLVAPNHIPNYELQDSVPLDEAEISFVKPFFVVADSDESGALLLTRNPLTLEPLEWELSPFLSQFLQSQNQDNTLNAKVFFQQNDFPEQSKDLILKDLAQVMGDLLKNQVVRTWRA